jgi:hypothetical protein
MPYEAKECCKQTTVTKGACDDFKVFDQCGKLSARCLANMSFYAKSKKSFVIL